MSTTVGPAKSKSIKFSPTQGCQVKFLNNPENPENLKKVTFYYSFLLLEHHKGYIVANQY